MQILRTAFSEVFTPTPLHPFSRLYCSEANRAKSSVETHSVRATRLLLENDWLTVKGVPVGHLAEAFHHGLSVATPLPLMSPSQYLRLPSVVLDIRPGVLSMPNLSHLSAELYIKCSFSVDVLQAAWRQQT